jgi:hypothetical protein
MQVGNLVVFNPAKLGYRRHLPTELADIPMIITRIVSEGLREGTIYYQTQFANPDSKAVRGLPNGYFITGWLAEYYLPFKPKIYKR